MLTCARALWIEEVSGIRPDALCHDRQPHLKNALLADAFLDSLEQVRRRYCMRVFGYVIMPEHVHRLVSEPENGLLSRAIQALKISMNRKMQSRGPSPLWQKRYYDHNVRSYESFVVKLKYIHRNPVKRGLCANPMEWPWSSFRHYATAEAGIVEIESEWTAERRSGREPRPILPQEG